MSNQAIGFRTTCKYIAADYAFWTEVYEKSPGLASFLSHYLLPGTWAVFIARWVQYCYQHHLRLIARLLYLLNVWLNGSEITSGTQMGPGFILIHPVGTMICAKFGERVILAGANHIGSNGSRRDIGGGGGVPVVGDRVKIGVGASILGPVRIGSGANIAAKAVIFSDVPENCLIYNQLGPLVVKPVPADYSLFYH